VSAPQERPRVLHFFGGSALGGSELGAREYMRGQARFAHEALFLEPLAAAAPYYEEAGFAVASLELGRRSLLAVRTALARHIAARRIDLVHAYGLRPSLLVRLLGRRPALVQAIHSVDAHRPQWQALLDRATAGRVDRYITNSEAGARFLAAERHVARARIRVVANGIDVEAVARAAADRAARAATRAALGLDPARVVLLTVANLRAPKGLDVLVGTAARLAARADAAAQPFVWLVAGDGPLAADLGRDIERRGLAGTVRLLGFRTDVAALLAAADVFCLTSRREGVPVAILEAMAAGRPVVATRVGGVAELVAAGETGILLSPGDPAATAAALAELIASPARRAALGTAGQARARAHFTIDRAQQEIVAVYDEVLTARGGAAGTARDASATHTGR
jgi:glycosyltransferase involved in cell wall biosynthesis